MTLQVEALYQLVKQKVGPLPPSLSLFFLHRLMRNSPLPSPFCPSVLLSLFELIVEW